MWLQLAKIWPKVAVAMANNGEAKMNEKKAKAWHRLAAAKTANRQKSSQRQNRINESSNQ